MNITHLNCIVCSNDALTITNLPVFAFPGVVAYSGYLWALICILSYWLT